MLEHLKSSMGGLLVSGIFIAIIAIWWVNYDCPVCAKKEAKQKISDILNKYGTFSSVEAAEIDPNAPVFTDSKLSVDTTNQERWCVVDVSVHPDTSQLPRTVSRWLVNPKGEWFRIPRNYRKQLATIGEGQIHHLPYTTRDWPRELTIEPQLLFDTRAFSARMLRGEFCHMATRDKVLTYIHGIYFFNTPYVTSPPKTYANQPSVHELSELW
jgi:hypothetical protein